MRLYLKSLTTELWVMCSKSFLLLPKKSRNSKVKAKFALLCLCAFVVFSCAKSSVSTDTARKIIAKQLEFPEKQINISTVSQTGNTVLAEGSLKLAFIFQKDESGYWKLLKIRHASNRWETPEEFQQYLLSSSFARALHSAFLAQLQEENSPQRHRDTEKKQ